MDQQIHSEIIDKKVDEFSFHLDCLKQTPLWYPPKIWRMIQRCKLRIFELHDLMGYLGILKSNILDEFEDILLSLIGLMGMIGFGGIIWFSYQFLYDQIIVFFTKKSVIFGITWWTEQPSWLIGMMGAIIVIIIGYIFLSFLAKKFWIYRLNTRLDKIKKQRQEGKIS